MFCSTTDTDRTRWWIAAGCVGALAWAAVQPATANQPDPNLGASEQTEWWIGAAVDALEICGFFGESSTFSDLADLTPVGRGAVGTFAHADAIYDCSGLARFAGDVLDNEDQIRRTLAVKYTCDSGGCQPGADAASAPALPAIDPPTNVVPWN